MHDFSTLTLSTERLSLRPLQAGDARALFDIHSDPEFMRYWSSLPWTSMALAEQMIERDRQCLAAGEHLRLGIVLRASAQLIGTCSLFSLQLSSRRAEIGYGIARPFWRCGYMVESVSALINHAFQSMGLNRLEADIDPRNTASAKSLFKLGFRQEGLLRERWIVGTEVSDTALFGLLASEWPPGALTAPASSSVTG